MKNERPTNDVELAYTACTLRAEGRSIDNVAEILNISVAKVKKLTTRVVIYLTAQEAVVVYNLAGRDNSSRDLSEFTLKAWHEKAERDNLMGKKPIPRTSDYRRALRDKFQMLRDK